ncbi:hypothetical protein G6553_01540 [Nocardioides sp. IC4_145]|uniref:hypothetical protein n=1 Tax=Nocardioides sp. IC4_145 TaxID=2714037 RepID=UPI00140749D9|nr:hypothetical protein [Nocardioides sp. IC4_145]NHC21857.1 hypothetical protein [Nocardioides sp. IC4_145]
MPSSDRIDDEHVEGYTLKQGSGGLVEASTSAEEQTVGTDRCLYVSPELADILERFAADPDAYAAEALPRTVTLRPV